MRIVVLNVKYSPNLGDGLLSECLESELASLGSGQGPMPLSVDLAGRAAYGEGGRYRRMVLAMLVWLPGNVRRFAAGIALGRLVATRLRPMCRDALAHADAVVLGGGNLLADADLNFPIKVACALEEAAVGGVPVGVFGVGISDNWSERGGRLFGQALAGVRLAHAAVRDRRSQALWARNLAPYGLPPATLCRDPGLLTAVHFPATAPSSGRIGFCLTDPLALRYHGGAAGGALDDRLVAIAAALVARGHRLALFTNGSPEDRAYLARVVPRFRAACGAGVDVVPAFARPADLARFIASCAAILAHRMHACIAAYAYRVPHVGFAWDPKLDSFFESVGRAGYVVAPGERPIDEVVALTERAIGEGIDADRHAAVVADARADVARLHAALAGAVAG